VKLNITVFNKPEVVAGFFIGVMKVSEFFRRRMAIANGTEKEESLDGLALLRVKPGGTTDLEIIANGADSGKALRAARHLTQQRYSEGVYLLN
jgi:hypothetical protein